MQESPTLDLVNDYFQFATKFFGTISTSAPHIYHTAVPLSPRMSMVWKECGPHAHPLVRVVHGIPASWDLSTATFKHTSKIGGIAWSPCSRLIAVAPHSPSGMQILDVITLEPLFTTSPIDWLHGEGSLIFSPDGHLLTLTFCEWVATWDLQTGGIICDMKICERIGFFRSITYSECGTMIGVLFNYPDSSTIYTFNILDGIHLASHSCKKQTKKIWACDGYLQFVTMEEAAILIWKTTFTPGNQLEVVRSLSIPNADCSFELFHPAFLHLVTSSHKKIHIWDLKRSKCLLELEDSIYPAAVSYSVDGCFFVDMSGPAVTIWRVSPTGYTIFREITSMDILLRPLEFSPSGESVIIRCAQDAFQLFPLEVSETHHSNPLTQGSFLEGLDFPLEFSPGNTLAVFAQKRGVVTVFDLMHCIPSVIIDVKEVVYATRIVGNTVFVACKNKMLAWNVPSWGGNSNHMGFGNSTSVTEFSHWHKLFFLSISPDSHYLSALVYENASNIYLYIHDTITGSNFKERTDSTMTWFTPDNSEVCSLGGYKIRRWKIVKDGRSHSIKLEYQEVTEDPPGGFPWHSACGYRITDDGWILSPSGRHLLHLPHLWQLGNKKRARKWSGHYLALLHDELPEPVILDLESGV